MEQCNECVMLGENCRIHGGVTSMNIFELITTLITMAGSYCSCTEDAHGNIVACKSCRAGGALNIIVQEARDQLQLINENFKEVS